MQLNTMYNFKNFIVNDEVDFKILFKNIVEQKKIIYICIIISFLITSLFLFLLPNKYTSKLVISPRVEESSFFDSIGLPSSGIFSGIASSNIDSSKTNSISESIEILKSLAFFDILINEDVTIGLMATKGWSQKSNTLIIDKSKYDISSNKWKKLKNDQTKPSLQDVHIEYLNTINILRDKSTNIITITATHYSPYFARDLLKDLIFNINETSRNDDIRNAEESIEYLYLQVESTEYIEVKNLLLNLIQEQVQKIMIAKSTPEYVFKIIEPPFVSEYKSGPQRITLFILINIISVALILLLSVIRSFVISRNLENN